MNACHKVYAVSQGVLQYHEHWFGVSGGLCYPGTPVVSRRSFLVNDSCGARAGSCQAIWLSGSQTSNPDGFNACLRTTRVVRLWCGQVWRIEDLELVAVKPEWQGYFFGGDCYLILYTYLVNSKQHYILYMWQVRRGAPLKERPP